MLATLAPFADDLLCYPGSDIRPQDGRYALSFAVPIATPGLKFICRDSYSKQRDTFDYPLSSRFDEMDCVVVFDDVEIPKERVFLDGDTVGYSEVITDTGWRGHIMHQAFTRAYVKLFIEHVWRPFERAGEPQAEWPRVRDALDRLRPLATESVSAAFGLEFVPGIFLIQPDGKITVSAFGFTKAGLNHIAGFEFFKPNDGMPATRPG